MPRFVIQEHHSELKLLRRDWEKRICTDRDSEQRKKKTHHFDLMLEKSGVLKTWSLEKLPYLPADKHAPYHFKLVPQQIKHLPDHRVAYLAYEGKISRNRGSVKIWDKGVYHCILWKDNFKVVAIRGRKINGLLIILPLLLLPLLRLLPIRHS